MSVFKMFLQKKKPNRYKGILYKKTKKNLSITYANINLVLFLTFKNGLKIM